MKSEQGSDLRKSRRLRIKALRDSGSGREQSYTDWGGGGTWEDWESSGGEDERAAKTIRPMSCSVCVHGRAVAVAPIMDI